MYHQITPCWFLCMYCYFTAPSAGRVLQLPRLSTEPCRLIRLDVANAAFRVLKVREHKLHTKRASIQCGFARNRSEKTPPNAAIAAKRRRHRMRRHRILRGLDELDANGAGKSLHQFGRRALSPSARRTYDRPRRGGFHTHRAPPRHRADPSMAWILTRKSHRSTHRQ